MSPAPGIPPIFAIGDLQGCAPALDSLLALLPRQTGDALWFAGDLVNRGPDSLGSLRRLRAAGPQVVSVLGNHDLHLLAAAAGVRTPSRRDTLAAVLAAPETGELIDWLRHRPLAHLSHGHLMVHAGVHPWWEADEAIALADEVASVLRGPHWRDFIGVMYGNQPARWDPSLTGDDRLRLIVNVFTRMRFVQEDGSLELDSKEGGDSAPAGCLPWFDVPGRRTAGKITVVFGHWSTQGLILRDDLLGLDTGCVWGGKLTAIRLADRQLWQVDCEAASPIEA